MFQLFHKFFNICYVIYKYNSSYIPIKGGPRMGGKREKPEDIVLKLRQVEVLQGQGKPLADAVRQIGVTVQTYYR